MGVFVGSINLRCTSRLHVMLRLRRLEHSQAIPKKVVFFAMLLTTFLQGIALLRVACVRRTWNESTTFFSPNPYSSMALAKRRVVGPH